MKHLSNTILFLGWLAFTCFCMTQKAEVAIPLYITSLILGVFFLIANNEEEELMDDNDEEN